MTAESPPAFLVGLRWEPCSAWQLRSPAIMRRHRFTWCLNPSTWHRLLPAIGPMAGRCGMGGEVRGYDLEFRYVTNIPPPVLRLSKAPLARSRAGSLNYATSSTRAAGRGAAIASIASAVCIILTRRVLMVRVALLLAGGILLTACSGSNRAEDILPAWANSPPSSATHYVTQRKHAEARSKPDTLPQAEAQTQGPAGPQETEKPVTRSLHEE
jgi:hypothetical protein